LQSTRTLEYESFKNYIDDKRVEKDELVVVFHKKTIDVGNYCFFSIYTKERIGAVQFALAILVNLFSGILLFLAMYKNENSYKYYSKEFWSNLPWEVYFSLLIGFAVIIYFIWPKVEIVWSKIKK
jgi:hypothetical protein